MYKTLITLADKLDQINYKVAADIVDQLIKCAHDNDWEIDAPTRVGIDVTPSSLPKLDPGALEQEDAMSGFEIVSKLRSVFHSLPNPDAWEDDVKVNVLKLIDRLREIL